MTDINIGQICNNSCVMCTTIRTKDRSAKQYLIPKAEILSKLDQIQRPEYIAFTGGEPTIRQDLIEIINYARMRFPEVEIKLLTNGRMLIYADYCKKLISSGIDTFIIPIHAHEQGLHDFITRSKGSFKQTIRGIKNITRFNVNVEIRIVIHGLNYPFLPEIAELINRFSNCKVVFLYFDIIGSAYLNKEKLVIPISKVSPYLQDALDILNKEVMIYHVPPCTIQQDYRKYLAGKTVEDRRITFLDSCSRCLVMDKCCGIWKTYAKIIGTDEFKPIE